MLKYNLDESILARATKTEKMHSFLPFVFEELVLPLTKALRKIMVQNIFVSEAEIFTSDLHFKMFDDRIGNQHKGGDGPMKHEDSCENLKFQLDQIKKRFDKVYLELLFKPEVDGDKTNLAVATYLATYFDQNQSSQNYFRANKKCQHLVKFVRGHFGKVMFNEQYQTELQSSFDAYLSKAMEATANGEDSDKLLELVQHKKLFSPFWLLPCGVDLLKSQRNEI